MRYYYASFEYLGHIKKGILRHYQKSIRINSVNLNEVLTIIVVSVKINDIYNCQNDYNVCHVMRRMLYATVKSIKRAPC
jgi:hypothetical protein